MMNGGEATGTRNGTTSSSPTSRNNGRFFTAEYEAFLTQLMELNVMPKMYILVLRRDWFGLIDRCSTHPNELRSLRAFHMTPLLMTFLTNTTEEITQPEAVKCICTLARVVPEAVILSCSQFMNASPISIIWSMITKERLNDTMLLERQTMDVSTVSEMIQSDTNGSTEIYNHRCEALVEILLKLISGLKTRDMIPTLQTTFYNALDLCQMSLKEKGAKNGITQIDQQILIGINLLYSYAIDNVPKYLSIISDFDLQVFEEIQQVNVFIKIYDKLFLEQNKQEVVAPPPAAELSSSLQHGNYNSRTSKNENTSNKSKKYHGVIPFRTLQDISKQFYKAYVDSGEPISTTSLHVVFKNTKPCKNHQTPQQQRMICQMIKLFPHWLHMKDTDGFIPLHYICGNASSFQSNVTCITKMLAIDKTIAQIKTPLGEYPYDLALENNVTSSNEGMKALLDSYPEVLATNNPKTKLQPFMAVALRQPLSWVKMKQLLRTSTSTKVSETYTLLRQMPEVLSQHVEKTSTCYTTSTTSSSVNSSKNGAAGNNSRLVFILSIFIFVSGCAVAIILYYSLFEAGVF